VPPAVRPAFSPFFAVFVGTVLLSVARERGGAVRCRHPVRSLGGPR
jgi:hypothetical protein